MIRKHLDPSGVTFVTIEGVLVGISKPQLEKDGADLIKSNIMLSLQDVYGDLVDDAINLLKDDTKDGTPINQHQG